MDVLKKALKVFDEVIVAIGQNPDKRNNSNDAEVFSHVKSFTHRTAVMSFNGLLVDVVKQTGVHAVIRGLRNGQDLEYEKVQQYWNEDLGLEVPVVYFITDRKLSHISSSTIRMVKSIKGN